MAPGSTTQRQRAAAELFVFAGSRHLALAAVVPPDVQLAP